MPSWSPPRSRPSLCGTAHRRDRAELRGHPTRVHAISLCEVDGRATAVSTGSFGDGLARVWDLETGRLLHRLDGGGASLGPLVMGVLGDQVIAATVNGDSEGKRAGEVESGTPHRRPPAPAHLRRLRGRRARPRYGRWQADPRHRERPQRGERPDLEPGNRRADSHPGRQQELHQDRHRHRASGRPVLVTGGGDVCLWDLTDGTKISTFGDH